MTDIPKRPGRPPIHASSAARAAASKARRGVARVDLPRDTLTALDALAQRHGDPSRPACIARLVREAVGRLQPENTHREPDPRLHIDAPNYVGSEAELIAALAAGDADIDAGRTVSFDEIAAELRRNFGKA